MARATVVLLCRALFYLVNLRKVVGGAGYFAWAAWYSASRFLSTS